MLVFVSLFLNCDNVLDEKVKTFYTEDTFYQTKEDAILAINGIYGHLGGTFDAAPNATGLYFANHWTINAVMSDNGLENIPGSPFDEISKFVLTPENAVVSQIWSNIYLAINAANLAIAHIPDIDMDEELKEELLGEAYFMRGLLYFELVRFYGDVPLQLEATKSFKSDSYLPRSLKEDVYAQIFEDLFKAEASLPEVRVGDNKGRPTIWAAKAFIAKAVLKQGENYQLAKTKLEEIINSGQFGLWSDYAEVFKIANNIGKEAVFSISFLMGNDINSTLWEGGHLVFRTLPGGVYGGRPNGGGLESPTMDLYNAFEDNDRRKEVGFMTQDVINGKVVTFDSPQVIKYWDREAEPLVNNTENDLQLIRYAGVLLMYAEVLNEINQGSTPEALDAINQVRRRARFADGAERLGILPDLTTMDYESFKSAILHERRLELFWEGHRWFDLVRFGKLAEKVKLAKPDSQVTEPTHELLPIPQRERDINKNLEQNQGY